MTQTPTCTYFYCDQKCQINSLWIDIGIAAIFTILTIIISAININLHLCHYNNPHFQSRIIIILLMAPFYCITSISSILWPKFQAYLTLTRDLYEALLLFTFFYLILSYLAYNPQTDLLQDKLLYEIMIRNQKQVPHYWPINYCQKPYQLTTWQKAKYFTYRCKKYILQFLIIKPLATFFMYILYPIIQKNLYGAQILGNIIEWIQMISVTYSLYYLVLFYHALKKPLESYSPLLKFLTIKVTLFFTFWQKIVISLFKDVAFNCFDKNTIYFDPVVLVQKFENTLICFQMFLMAIAGGIAYSYIHYKQSKKTHGNFIDVFDHTFHTVKNDIKLIKPKEFGFKTESAQQYELQDMRDLRRSSAKVEINKNDRLSKRLLDDYF